MQTNIKKLVSTITWAASSDKELELPTEGLITRIDIAASITASGSMAAANQPDHISRVIQNLQIQGGGGRNYLGMSGEQMGRVLHLMNLCDFNCPMNDVLATTNEMLFRVHCGSQPRDAYGRDNPFDLSAVIPGQGEKNLKLKLTTTANDVMDDVVTISSGTYYATVYQVLGMERWRDPSTGVWYWVDPKSGLKVPAMVPVSSTQTLAHSANKSDLSEEIDMPGGSYMRRIAMLVQDETATRPVRKNDEVTGVGIKLVRESSRLLDVRWNALRQGTFANNRVNGAAGLVADTAIGAVAIPDGFAMIDFRAQNLGHPLYGWDLRGYGVGDVVLGLTIENYAAGDDTIVFFDQVQPLS